MLALRKYWNGTPIVGYHKGAIEQTQKLTNRPFAINFTNRTFNEEIFRLVVEEAKSKIISYALGDPGGVVKQAHDAGILFMQQVRMQSKHVKRRSSRSMP